MQTRALAIGLALLLLGCPATRAQGRPTPTPPPRKPVLYDPDPATCRADAVRTSFARQLQPFADQSPAVLQKLRGIQWQLTASTLKRCVGRGLMDAATAEQLRRELLKPGMPSLAAGHPATRP